jgi:alpha-amylase
LFESGVQAKRGWVKCGDQGDEWQISPWEANAQGYWVVDPSKPNPHFGTADDLRALSDALHARGMYLMVDVVPNHLASTTTDISNSALATKEGGRLYFKDRKDYHEPCGISWGNSTSEQVW